MKGAIFDVDGTLLDSMSIWTKADAIYLARHNITATEELSRLFFNMTLEKSIAYMHDELNIPDSPATIKHDILKIVEDFYEHEVELKEYMYDIIQALKAKHIPLVIATSNTKSIIEKALSRLNVLDDFVYILTCDEAGVDKTTPAIYLKAAQYTNSSPDQTFVFEDALHGASSAKEGGFKVVGIFDEYSKDYKHELKAIADYYLESEEDYQHFLQHI